MSAECGRRIQCTNRRQSVDSVIFIKPFSFSVPLLYLPGCCYYMHLDSRMLCSVYTLNGNDVCLHACISHSFFFFFLLLLGHFLTHTRGLDKYGGGVIVWPFDLQFCIVTRNQFSCFNRIKYRRQFDTVDHDTYAKIAI